EAEPRRQCGPRQSLGPRSWWFSVTLSPCHLVTLSPCHPVIYSSRPVEVGLVLRPGILGDGAAQFQAIDVVRLDVVTPHDPGDASYRGGGAEGGQLQRHVAGQFRVRGELPQVLLHDLALDPRLGERPGGALLHLAETVAAGEQLEHLRRRPARRAVP